MDVSQRLDPGGSEERKCSAEAKKADFHLALLLQGSTQRHLHHLLFRPLPVQVSSMACSRFGSLLPCSRRSPASPRSPFHRSVTNFAFR